MRPIGGCAADGWPIYAGFALQLPLKNKKNFAAVIAV
jgi:hypothetical protein